MRGGLLALCLSLFGVIVACGDGADRHDSNGPGSGEPAGWQAVGGGHGGGHYSPLDEITPDNVHRLERLWTRRLGMPAIPGPAKDKTALQVTPILRDGRLLVCTPDNRIVALDPATGEALWTYAADPHFESGWTATCRGVAAWEGDAAADAGACRSRVFMGTIDARLVAVDAETGRPCDDFGVGGEVSLLHGLGDVLPGEYYMTSAPTVAGDVVITGALVADNRRVDPPGGVVRAFDARTGALVWAFDPVPPGTPPPPPDEEGRPTFHRGTPNVWSVPSVDVERELVFLPFGNPSPDFYGGLRRGFDHYGSSVVALHARTGEVAWHFQTVHHDLWDYDVSSQPMLVDVPVQGVMTPAVVQLTKMGHVFILDRETGVPLFPVEERPVPASDVPGETAARTQPFPTHPPPLHPHALGQGDAFGFTPFDRGACRELVASLRNEGIFTPPSVRGTVLYPGTAGGSNWGAGAYDPARRLLVLNVNRIGQSIRLLPRSDAPTEKQMRGVSPQAGAPYAAKSEVLLSPFGVPCSPPPWGSILAVDLERGEVVWERPFGTTRDMTPVPVGIELGLPSMGGPIVTAGGLAFIGAALDDYIRAYDVETGEEVWRERLPAGAQATPMTYRLEPGGRQIVVIAAGGHATMGTTRGDWLIAWALPE